MSKPTLSISFSADSENAFKFKQVAKQLLIFLLFWLLPFVLLYCFSSDFSFWQRLILFFTQTAFFTIGGSYTVLPYVAQFAVGKLGWLTKMQMVDGFALAETTPGPLIIVVGFVGFMAGYHRFNASIPMGSLALLITIFYTFFTLLFVHFCRWSAHRKIAWQYRDQWCFKTGYGSHSGCYS